MEDLFQIGIITGTHGLKGEVKVFPTTDDKERFLDLDTVLIDTGKETVSYTHLDVYKRQRLAVWEWVKCLFDNRSSIEYNILNKRAGRCAVTCPGKDLV